MNLSYISVSEANTLGAGAYLSHTLGLRPEWGRIVLLSGELGSGKTRFVQGILKEFGIQTAGKSPTFTFFREHTSQDHKVLHADLYRLGEAGAEQQRESLREMLEHYFSEGYILLIEWPELLGKENFWDSENRVEVSLAHGKHEEERVLKTVFHNSGSISEGSVHALMEEYCTPVHVRKHIEAVTKVAVQISEALFQKGVLMDLNLVKCSALCHDLVRYVDFPNFENLSHYQEEITEEKLRTWKDLHQKYKKIHHADAIADILRERGFDATAKVVEAHNTSQIFRKEPFSWPEKVVYYADKRALHDTIVSLKERFADGRKRYSYEASPELENKVFVLEKEIFEYLDIEPEDIS